MLLQLPLPAIKALKIEPVAFGIGLHRNAPRFTRLNVPKPEPLRRCQSMISHTQQCACPYTPRKKGKIERLQFNTLRLRLLKIAARVIEHGRRIRVHLPSSCVEKTLFRTIALGLLPSGP